MTYSNLIKTGLGIGLLAVSLGAGATAIDGKHNFGSASIYVKQSSTGTNYTAFMPSGNQSTDSVIVVEHLQGASATAPMTWTYMLPVGSLGGFTGYSPTFAPGGAFNASANISSIFSPAISSTWAVQSSTGSAGTVSKSDFGWGNSGQGATSTYNYMGVTQTQLVDTPSPIAALFSYPITVSGQACGISAMAVIDNNDILQWGNIIAQPVTAVGGWLSASANGPVTAMWVSASATATATAANSKTVSQTNYYGSTTYPASLWNNVTASNAFATLATNATLMVPNSTATNSLGVGSGTNLYMPVGNTTTSHGFVYAISTAGGVSGYSPMGAVAPSNTTMASLVSVAASTHFTIAGSAVNNLLKGANYCGVAYSARAALNGAPSLVLGSARGGLTRLW